MGVSKHKQLGGAFQYKRNFVADPEQMPIPPSRISCYSGGDGQLGQLHVLTTCRHNFDLFRSE